MLLFATDSDLGLIIALCVCLGLLLLCVLGAGAYLLSVRRKSKKQAARAEESAEATSREEDLPEEVLLAILTAAVYSVLGEESASGFRVVSFRRLHR